MNNNLQQGSATVLVSEAKKLKKKKLTGHTLFCFNVLQLT